MSRFYAEQQSVNSAGSANTVPTRLSGSWLLLARILWLGGVILLVALCLVMLPAFDTLLQTICTGAACDLLQPTPESAQSIQGVGLSLSAYATLTLTLSLASVLLGLVVSGVIFWRKSDDWMALLVAASVVALSTLYITYTFQGSPSAWQALAIVLNVLGNGVFFLVCTLFPNGRFVPRWLPWLHPCWLGAGIVFFIFRDVSFIALLYNVVWLVVVVVLVIALFYRYRYASTPIEQQQTKWVIYGGSVAGIIVIALTVPLLLFPPLRQAGSFYQLIITPTFLLTVLIVQVCTGLAILRFRLYDIDLLINRTLVYGTLTVLLALVYAGLVIGLGALVRLVTGEFAQSPLVIVASTLAIAGLFQPLRQRIQAIIDRRFYRRQYDAARTIAAFSATLRNEVDVDTLRDHLLAVVQATMQPTHVWLWVPSPTRRARHSQKAGEPFPQEDGVRPRRIIAADYLDHSLPAGLPPGREME